APLQPICPAAGHLLDAGGFRPIPTLTNLDPPRHSRLRRLANVAFTPRRVAAMEPFVRELPRNSHQQQGLCQGGKEVVGALRARPFPFPRYGFTTAAIGFRSAFSTVDCFDPGQSRPDAS